MEINKIYNGNALEVLKTFPDECIDCCVTSPPYYGLRDYGVEGQLGIEDTPKEYVQDLVNVFNEVKRVLKNDGTLWLNLGDSYAGGGHNGKRYDINPNSKQFTNKGAIDNYTNGVLCKVDGCKAKDLIGIPWMTAFALREAGWYLRQDIIWAKPNPMPESVKDRCTRSHEYIFLLSKNKRYYFDMDKIKEPTLTEPKARNKASENFSKKCNYPNGNRFSKGTRVYGEDGFRNKRDVWTVNNHPFKGEHFATFPEELIEPCILAGCKSNGVVLDVFMGSGTTGVVAKKYGRNYVGIELNEKYIEIANNRIAEIHRSTPLLPKELY